MPVIRVEMLAGRSPAQKQAFAQAVTDSFVALCGGTPQSVQVVFQDVAKADWAVAGTLLEAPAPETADTAKQAK